MGAFPANSANNTMGGSGPVNKHINLEQFHGRGTEGFHDYAASSYDLPKPADLLQPQVMNATNKVEPLHGEESLGLGTSTFLEGAPASRAAMQRTKSENTGIFEGVTRKKSIAQRFRGMSQSKSRPVGQMPPTPSLPEEYGENGSPVQSPVRRKPARLNSESNPLESQHDDAYEKKGAAIKEAEVAMAAPLSPKREPLTRRTTADNNSGSPEPKSPKGGLLNRVKSLKKVRNDRNPS
jgi:hypothetical protein